MVGRAGIEPANEDETVRGWTGHHRDELIGTWAAPEQEATLQDGGKRVLSSNNWGDGYGVYTCRRVFMADGQGIIRSSSSSHC